MSSLGHPQRSPMAEVKQLRNLPWSSDETQELSLSTAAGSGSLRTSSPKTTTVEHSWRTLRSSAGAMQQTQQADLFLGASSIITPESISRWIYMCIYIYIYIYNCWFFFLDAEPLWRPEASQFWHCHWARLGVQGLLVAVILPGGPSDPDRSYLNATKIVSTVSLCLCLSLSLSMSLYSPCAYARALSLVLSL